MKTIRNRHLKYIEGLRETLQSILEDVTFGEGENLPTLFEHEKRAYQKFQQSAKEFMGKIKNER